MRRIYLRAGLYAEGPSDYAFLGRLLPRVLEDITAACFPGMCDIEETIEPLDAPDVGGGRTEKIPAAVAERGEWFEILVIHVDGGKDPKEMRRTCVESPLTAIRAAQPEAPLYAAACVPVREIEAWMLADVRPFQEVLASRECPALPSDPERIDPKPALKRILQEGGARLGSRSIYDFFGARVRLSSLRALSAFRAFEAELTAAVREFVAAQGHRLQQ